MIRNHGSAPARETMRTQKPFATGLRCFTVALIALGLLLIPSGDARAITFSEWASSQHWPDNIAPDWVCAIGESLDSLAGISNYDWTTTPTTTLELTDNRIKIIESGTFSALGKLTYLNLESGGITSIEAGAFAGLGSLAKLYLSFNPITSVEYGDFSGLGNLMFLDLQSTSIWSIASGAFIGLENLIYLNFEGSRITRLESGAFAGLGSLTRLGLGGNYDLIDLNLDGADFTALTNFDVHSLLSTRVSLRNTRLNQTSLVALVDGEESWTTGIGELPTVTELDLSGVDFAAITDLSPLYLMDHLTDLWVVGTRNLDANKLDVLLDNLATMEDTNVEGVLHMTQADYNAWNAAGGGKLARWNAELGHHVQIVPEPSVLALLAGAVIAMGLFRLRRAMVA
jgi:hypothetical protein